MVVDREIVWHPSNDSLTPLGVGVFLSLVAAVAIGTGWLLSLPVLRFARPILVEAGLYAVVILALAYVFMPAAFTRRYWHLPVRSLKWVGLVVVVQSVAIYAEPQGPPVSRAFAFGALIVAPLVEEVVRAIALCSLVEEWGAVLAVIATTPLFVIMHSELTVRMAVGQLMLSVLLLQSSRSIPASAIAHSLMNVLALGRVGVVPN
jgi:hypothetical protein